MTVSDWRSRWADSWWMFFFFTQVYIRRVMLTSWWMLCVFYSGVPPHQLGHVDELVDVVCFLLRCTSASAGSC